jgi:uncharacterized metal-binding protein YceD (DUF177 family)
MQVELGMKVLVKDMREPKTIDIQGSEPWLNEIYSTFLGNEGYGLQGQIKVSPEEYGVFTVIGKVDYVPLVGCSRCDKEIPWPINKEINVRFIDRDAAEAGFDFEDEEGDEDVEREIDSQDIDTYYLDQSHQIDIEMVINDIVQTALPTRLILMNKDGKSCRICLDNIDTAVVYKDKNDVDMSPFAALKNLKLPDA